MEVDKFIRYMRELWYGLLLVLAVLSVIGMILMLVDCARLLTKL